VAAVAADCELKNVLARVGCVVTLCE